MENVAGLMFQTRAPSTVDKYARAYGRWREWANRKGHAALPADPGAICAYLQHLAASSSSKPSVVGAVHALSWAHTIAGLQSPTSHPAVTAVHEAYSRVLAAPKTKKEALTVTDMRRLVDQQNDVHQSEGVGAAEAGSPQTGGFVIWPA